MPDYQGYRRNSQRCIVVYELRRRGYAVTAAPNPYIYRSGTTKRWSFNGSQCFTGVRHEYYRLHLDFAFKEFLNGEFAKRVPDETRLAIHYPLPACKGSAHAIVAEKANGRFVFIDPQRGESGDHVLQCAHPEFGYRWFQMNNLELHPDFEWDEIAVPEKKAVIEREDEADLEDDPACADATGNEDAGAEGKAGMHIRFARAQVEKFLHEFACRIQHDIWIGECIAEGPLGRTIQAGVYLTGRMDSMLPVLVEVDTNGAVDFCIID